MKISLTFDNGPDPEVTSGVLDTLTRFGVKATFFIVGQNLEHPAARKVAARAHAEGHRIGNHSYTHSTPFGLLDDPGKGVEEVLATEKLLGDLAGEEHLYRPFGGGEIGKHLLNRPTWDLLIRLRYTCVLWDFVTPERALPGTWMKPTLEACRQREWTVLVMHDTDWGGSAQLDVFLKMALEAGAEFAQDFPDHCVPLRRGVVTGDAQRLMK